MPLRSSLQNNLTLNAIQSLYYCIQRFYRDFYMYIKKCCIQLFGHMQHSYYFTYMEYGLLYYTIPCAVIAVAQGLSVYAVFAFICILLAYYQRSPFRFYTILHRFRLSVNMQMNRIRFCLRIPHNTNVFRCRLCSNHNTVPMIRLALK